MAGRNRKFVEREANGRPKRPSAMEIKERERERRMVETSVVLAQPHRRIVDMKGNVIGGDADPRRVSALGRFCQRMKCRGELLDAATDYAKYRRWWGNAVGRPRGFDNASAGAGSGDGPSDETVRSWVTTYVGVDMMLSKSVGGPRAFAQFYKLVIDDADPPQGDAMDNMLVTALRDVAIHMGRMSAKQTAF